MSLSNKISKDALKAGDHIYTWRNVGLYSHHGIYIGNEKVIHFTNEQGQEVGTGTFLDRLFSSSSSIGSNIKSECVICGDQSKESGVILSCLDCFLKGSDLYLCVYGVGTFTKMVARGGTSTRVPSDPPEKVIFRATFLHKNKGFGSYNLLKNNCEDFAIYCKTEFKVSGSSLIGTSGQCKAVVTNGLNGIFRLFGILGLSDAITDIVLRPDVKKVSVESLI